MVYFTMSVLNSLQNRWSRHANMIEYLNIFIQVVEQGSLLKLLMYFRSIAPPWAKQYSNRAWSGCKTHLSHNPKAERYAEGDEFYHHARHVLAEVNDIWPVFHRLFHREDAWDLMCPCAGAFHIDP